MRLGRGRGSGGALVRDERGADLVYTGADLPHWMGVFPRPRAILLLFMNFASRRVSGGKWSARRALAFVVVASMASWALLIGAVVAISHLVHN